MFTIKDPLYKLIEVEDEFASLIDNPYFQRLRNIKQDALLYFVYPSAKHDRFSHSLGTYHLMKEIVNNGLMDLSKEDKFNLKAAALLHDIGHGPYSHTWEHMAKNFDHEAMSVKIIREIFNLPIAADIIEKKHPYYKLLSSVIDVDKLDYMARDSYFCGVSYGYSDVERIVRSISVVDGELVIPPSLVPSVEHVIMGRISLYKSTYFHPSCQSKDALLDAVFGCVRDLYSLGHEVFVDPLLAKFLDGTNVLSDFLYLDDSVLEFHLNKWRTSKNAVLHDLANRFFSRKSFIAKDLLVAGEEFIPALKKKVNEKYLFHLYYHETKFTKGVYENEVYVKIPNKPIVPLSEFSEHIAGIIKTPIKVNMVIFPKELD